MIPDHDRRPSVPPNRDTDTCTPEARAAAGDEAVSLVSLLGEQRAAIVERLRCEGEQTVADLAQHLDVSEVATRRHLAVLDEDGFVTARTVPQGRGRPVARYRLTERARALFPQRYASMASELMDFITSEHGREGLRSYLKWRLERQTEAFGDVVTAADLHDRLHQLAEALSDAGYDATVEEDGAGFRLTQDHCAIYDVAKHHPEMCAYEAAAFSKVLGDDVSISRRDTLTHGATACVCTVTPRRDTTAGSATGPADTEPRAAPAGPGPRTDAPDDHLTTTSPTASTVRARADNRSTP